MNAKKRLLTGVIGAGMLGALTALPPASAAEGLTDALIEDLRGGGYVLFIRHASTEKDYADQVSAEMGNCATQRTLSEAGWLEAQTIGAGFALHRIPVAKVISSQYCRAWQTAQLAFGRHVKSADLNFEPAEDYSDAQVASMRQRVRPHLSTMPPEGFNTVLVGHDDPFEAATGIYPEPMGVAYVVKPDGNGGFEIVTHINPDGWF